MMFSAASKQAESQSISSILKSGIQLEDVLGEMAAGPKMTMGRPVNEVSASQQYIDAKTKLQEQESSIRPVITRKIAPVENVLMGQIATGEVPTVQKSWSFTSNTKKSKVATSSSKKKGIKKQKAADYQDKLTMKMSAKFMKAKNRKS